MAKNKSTVYLGFDEEEINEKHVTQLNSTVNKIGGVADWPSGDIKVPACSLCGTARPLIVQIYAPLDNSQFHRTLYIFACLNPACSQNAKSWICIRTQHLDTAEFLKVVPANATAGNGGNGANGAISKGKKKKQGKQPISNQNISWCSGIDDWGDTTIGFDTANVFAKDGPEIMDTAADEDFDEVHQNEENGNVVSRNDNSPSKLLKRHLHISSEGEDNDDGFEDDEDDSNSMENDIICGFGQIDMHNHEEEDPNANCAAAVLGAGAAGVAAASDTDAYSVGLGAPAMMYAEIEGAETDVVLVETPQKPERDLIALLKHTSTPAALGPLAKITDVTLKPYFIAVDIEHCNNEHFGGSLSADHIRELYQEYKKQDEASHSPSGAVGGGFGVYGANAAGGGGQDGQESYEKVLPSHGDVIFHQFLTTLQQNPGQILRYSRDAYPLLIAPLAEPVPKCPNCGGETICELQILSTLIPKLCLQQNDERAPIEFGNVLVFTCLKSCWDTPDKMRYERILVQSEK